ncbi:hypothetical protein OAQ08_01865, partial [Alphaproteobacteria bacterium]|nr:hypothetical protein [Alphaproteobacteria bacterium]
MNIYIKKLHDQFFKEILGFRPTTGSIKPVHFINNISREILGYHFKNDDLYSFIEPRAKNKGLDPNRTFEKLSELSFYDQLENKSQFESLRRKAKGLLHSDGAVFANDEMISFTAANEFFIEKDSMGSYIKNYHKSLFELDIGRNKNLANLLSQNLISNQNDLEKLDPITILFYPLLSQNQKNDEIKTEDNSFLENELNSKFIEKYKYLAKNFYNNYSGFLEINRIKLFQKICHFSCVMPLLHFISLNSHSSRPVIFSANKEGKKINKIDIASHESYNNLYDDVTSNMCSYLSKKLNEDTSLIDKLNSLNLDDDEIINNFLNEFSFSDKEKENAKLGKNYLEDRKLIFDQFFDPDDRINSLAQVLNGIYEKEVNKSSQFKAFTDRLLKLAGVYYPGLRAPSRLTRFKPKYNIIELLVYTLIEETDQDNYISYQEFLKRLWDNYGIIIGGLNKGEWNDYEYLIDLNYDLDQEDLKENRKNFLDVLKSYGF